MYVCPCRLAEVSLGRSRKYCLLCVQPSTKRPPEVRDPHEVWYSRKPDLSNLRVFGCVTYALVPVAKRKKFDNRTEKMRFLGYHKGHRGYKLMEKGSNRVFYRTDVTFDENNFRLTEAKPAERRDEAPTVEVEVGSSGSRASQPAEVPVELSVDVPARQREDPEAVAAPVLCTEPC